MMRVSVSAYDDGHLLDGCLHSIRDVLGDVPIHVVDGKYETWPDGADNSTDMTPEICEDWGAEYDPAGPFPRERDKHVYRAERVPDDDWVLLLDADERLLAFDDSVLDRDVAYRPRIVNAHVYHDRTPIAYWPRLHKPEWVVSINRWDAYLYSTPEPPQTDRVTIVHRHDLRGREYREAKYERFENEDRTGRYVRAGLEDEYYDNELDADMAECPNCGATSVTWSPYSRMDTDHLSRVGVCTAGDGCHVEIETADIGEYRYLPHDWQRGLREDPERLQLECVDAGWAYATMAPLERFQEAGFGIRRWVEKAFGEEHAPTLGAD